MIDLRANYSEDGLTHAMTFSTRGSLGFRFQTLDDSGTEEQLTITSEKAEFLNEVYASDFISTGSISLKQLNTDLTEKIVYKSEVMEGTGVNYTYLSAPGDGYIYALLP